MVSTRQLSSIGKPSMAVMITDTAIVMNYHNYHQLTDTIDTLDLEKMSVVVNSTYIAVAGISQP